MTPAERAVIEAARTFVAEQGTKHEPSAVAELFGAVEALDAELKPDSAVERPRSWSEVVTEDEIYSTKTQKWYRVLSTVNQEIQVKVICEGMAKPFTVPAAAEVLVRRSEMGQAVDMWIDVMRSGPA